MKLIIDVPEKVYKNAREDMLFGSGLIANAIKNGTPMEQESCDDAVSRQAVLELVADYDLSMGQVVKGIHALPSVTPQPNKWIPVSERLPEEDGEYLATIYDMDENYEYIDIAELEDGKWCYKPYILVKAWMPLTEPYKAEGSEE